MTMQLTVEELQRKSQELRKFFDQYLPYERRHHPLLDFVRVQHEVMWGHVWLVPGLDLRLRSFATITAQCINGWDFGVEHQIRVGLTNGITPNEIKGMMIQLLFYAGVPATVHGLRVGQQVINERDEWKAQDVPIEADWLDDIEEKLKRGSAIRVENFGEQADRELENSFAQELVPEAADIVDGYNFGEAWARADLGPRERMVCILAALMCRGHMSQLKRYTGYALDAGLNKREICETFSQAGWYRGWPCVEDALEQAGAVFKERGL